MCVCEGLTPVLPDPVSGISAERQQCPSHNARCQSTTRNTTTPSETTPSEAITDEYPRPMRTSKSLSAVLAVLLMPYLLAACTTTSSNTLEKAPAPVSNRTDVLRYSAPKDEKFDVPPVDVSKIDPKYLRQLVDYPTDQPPGTIVVDPHNRFLYLVQEGGKALRYGVGVGKEGLEFTGTANVGYKREWPRWTPTQDMIKREPERYEQWADGMEGGATNPLGARALYLFKDGKDTLYRIHGTTEPWSIGQAVSSGCIRLLNQDVIDLYNRVPPRSKVVVR